MDKSEKRSGHDLGLRKHEIIRGHNAYLRILSNSGSFASGHLKAFVNKELTLSPLFTEDVKVGFIVAKKKTRKATERNRIRRLMKESYRINKNLLSTSAKSTSVLFSLSESGYKAFGLNAKFKRQDIDDDMKKLILKINREQ